MKHAGWSLLELLIVVALIAGMSLYAGASFRHLFVGTELTRSLNDLSMSLRLARSQAILNNHYLLVCPTTDQIHCNDSREWHSGWLVLSADEFPDNATPLHIERVQGPNAKLQISSNRDYFLFRPFGRRATNGTVVFCDRGAELPARALILSYTGRTRVSGTLPNGNTPQCAPQ